MGRTGKQDDGVRCPRCDHGRAWQLARGTRRCAGCRYEWRHGRMPLRLSPEDWGAVAWSFVLHRTAKSVADEHGWDRKRVLRAYTAIRGRLPAFVPCGDARSRHVETSRLRCGVRPAHVDLHLAEAAWRYDNRSARPADIHAALVALLRKPTGGRRRTA